MAVLWKCSLKAGMAGLLAFGFCFVFLTGNFFWTYPTLSTGYMFASQQYWLKVEQSFRKKNLNPLFDQTCLMVLESGWAWPWVWLDAKTSWCQSCLWGNGRTHSNVTRANFITLFYVMEWNTVAQALTVSLSVEWVWWYIHCALALENLKN